MAALRFREEVAREVDALLHLVPDDDSAKARLRARARAYARECGCSTGAAFMMAALMLVPVYFLSRGGGLGLWSALGAAAFISTAAMVGKAAGIALSYVRLLALRLWLQRRLTLFGAGNVDLH